MKTLLLLLGLSLMAGCSTIQDVPPATLQASIELATYNAALYGFKAVLRNNKDSADELRKDAGVAVQAIRENVLPFLAGEPTGQAMVDLVNTVFANLNISPSVKNIISSTIRIVVTEIHLPENPTDKLDAQTKASIVGLFTGMAKGLEEASK